MGWTKKQIVEQAYAELALAGYVFDLSPEEMDWARIRLDTMMATWSIGGREVGYVTALTPTAGDIDDDSGLPLIAIEAVYMQLAKRLAAGKGKQLPPSSLRSAADALAALDSYIASYAVQQQQRPSGTPMGAGNRLAGNFFDEPETTAILAGADGGLVFTGP